MNQKDKNGEPYWWWFRKSSSNEPDSKASNDFNGETESGDDKDNDESNE